MKLFVMINIWFHYSQNGEEDSGSQSLTTGVIISSQISTSSQSMLDNNSVILNFTHNVSNN